MDTKKLRQKILDLAIHGKLVPQDPNDEPASVLLERIRAEKERLIKEGKIKRPKKSASSDMSHYGNDMPFELPEGWVWCTVGDIYAHNTGKALNKADDLGQLLEYITTSNLYWDSFVLSDLRKMYFSDDELEKCTVQKGDLLVCEGGDIGRAAIWPYNYDIRIQNHIHRLRGILPINNRFYLYVLQLYKWTGLIGGKGIGLLGFSSRELDKLQVPLPPLHEQNRIVAFAERIFSTIATIEQSRDVLSHCITDTKAKIFDLAISGKLVPQDPTDEPAIDLLRRINPAFKPCDNPHYPYVIPESWQFVALGDITTFLSRGKSPKYSEEKLYPVFAQKCNQWEGITLEKVQFLEPDTLRKWPEEYKLQDGDVLVNSTGTGTLGRTGIFYTRYLGNYPFILPDSHVTVIRGNKVLISQEYLYLVSRSAYMQKWMVDNMVGSTNQKELYPKALEGFLLALPPRAEQDRIVSFAKMILENVEALAIGL